ncbi:MAG TPA: hypothetical protein VGD01_07805 [Candidatus Elarobacter sp.]|jgi:hypothetical protein
MNAKLLTAGALAATMTFGATAPALADGAASTRNILIGGAAAAVLITNYNHKVRQKREEQREQTRRQASYRNWYYRHYGRYPTDAQVNSWYYSHYSR